MLKRLRIDLKNVGKKYEDQFVVKGLYLQVYEGECVGLLGPNGAGKSTVLKILSGQVAADEGQAYVHGLNLSSQIKQIKSLTGVVPQADGLEDRLSVFENLNLFGIYFQIPKEKRGPRIDELLRLLRLEKYKDQNAEELSGGLKRRLTIARALLAHPQLLLLDEPTNGLDPLMKEWIWEFLKKAKVEQSLLLTTHDMEEAAVLCDRVALMDGGKVIALDTPQTLIQDHVGKDVAEFDVSAQDQSYYLTRLREKKLQSLMHRGVLCVYTRHESELKELMDLVRAPRMTFRKPNLNDVFIRLTGHEIEVGESA